MGVQPHSPVFALQQLWIFDLALWAMEPSSYSYVVTANRPTAVSHALTCSLYGELPSLVVAKGTRLEVHLVARDDGPTLVHDAALHGRAARSRPSVPRPARTTACPC